MVVDSATAEKPKKATKKAAEGEETKPAKKAPAKKAAKKADESCRRTREGS